MVNPEETNFEEGYNLAGIATIEGGATDGREARNSSSSASQYILHSIRNSNTTDGNLISDLTAIYFRGWDGYVHRMSLLAAISNHLNEGKTISYYNKNYEYLSRIRLGDVMKLWDRLGIVEKNSERYDYYKGNTESIRVIIELISKSRLLPHIITYTLPIFEDNVRTICTNVGYGVDSIFENYENIHEFDYYGVDREVDEI